MLLAFMSLICAPIFVNVATDETAPWFIATMLSSALGFILFDRELIRLRREAEDND